MADKVIKIMEQILRESFPGEVDEDTATALTTVLNRYNFYLSPKAISLSGPVELTHDLAIKLVSKLNISLAEPDMVKAFWLWRWVERYKELHNTPYLDNLIGNVVPKLRLHPLIEKIEDDWET